MKRKDAEVTKDNSATKQSSPRNAQPIKDSRDPIRYTIDRGFDAVGNELDRMEQEKPGTRRKLAGIASIGFGATGIGAGVYLLMS